MSEQFLGWNAANQRRNAVPANLNFSAKEWESLKALRETDSVGTNQIMVMNESDNNSGASEMTNKTIRENLKRFSYLLQWQQILTHLIVSNYYYTVLLAPDICNAQTKCMCISQQCEEEDGMHSLGAAISQAMLGTKAAAHHC